MKLEFDADALAELDEAIAWYEAQSPRVALEFRRAIDEAVAGLLEAPNRWPLVGAVCRARLLPHHPYRIVYVYGGNAITVLAIAHQRRRPEYWQSRLENE